MKNFFKIVKAISLIKEEKWPGIHLKAMIGDNKIDHPLLTKRPEQLSVSNFIELTKLLESKIK